MKEDYGPWEWAACGGGGGFVHDGGIYQLLFMEPFNAQASSNGCKYSKELPILQPNHNLSQFICMHFAVLFKVALTSP